jgi:hypothetical protein
MREFLKNLKTSISQLKDLINCIRGRKASLRYTKINTCWRLRRQVFKQGNKAINHQQSD